MIKVAVCATLLYVSVSAFGQGNSGKHDEENSITAPSFMWARGVNPRDAGGPRKGNASMTYHGGQILPTANIQAVFWGTTWTSTDPKIPGLESFYQGFSGSNYAQTSDEYTGSNGQVGPTREKGRFKTSRFWQAVGVCLGDPEFLPNRGSANMHGTGPIQFTSAQVFSLGPLRTGRKWNGALWRFEVGCLAGLGFSATNRADVAATQAPGFT